MSAARARARHTANERFCIAGLEVVLHRCAPFELSPLRGDYAHYPSAGGAPRLAIDIEQVPGFARDRPQSAGFPAFEASLEAPGRMRLSRIDAEGVLAVRDEGPVAGRFVCGESSHSVEAMIRIGASVALPRIGAVIVHGSVVVDDRGAHLFAAVSGTGKSTIARLLAERFDVETLSDELVILRRDESGAFWAHVAPFIGSSGLPHGERRRLVSLNLLHQALEHRRVALAPGPALRQFLRHVVVYAREPATTSLILDLASQIVTAVPAYDLHFLPDHGVAEVLGIT